MTSKLFEASLYSYEKELKPGGIAFYRTQEGIPSIMVFPLGTDDLKKADSAIIVRSNASAAKKRYDASAGGSNFDHLYRYLKRSDHLRGLLSDMITYPKEFKILEPDSREKMFKLLSTDLNMPPGLWEKHFGEVPELGEGTTTKFHNATVIVPEGMTKRMYDSVMATMEDVFQHLKRAGLGYVFACPIRFVQLTGKMGEYFTQIDEMRVSPRAKDTKLVVYTLLHEYIHRWWYKYSHYPTRVLIREKYLELRRAGHSFQDPQGVELMMAAMDMFQPGDQVQYVGRKRELKAHGPIYTIKRIEGNNAYLTGQDDPSFVRMRVGLINLLTQTNKWRPVEQRVAPIKKRHAHELDTEEWFPSKYSEQDDEEWFAELASLYIMGRVGGAPAKWVKGVLAS